MEAWDEVTRMRRRLEERIRADIARHRDAGTDAQDLLMALEAAWDAWAADLSDIGD